MNLSVVIPTLNAAEGLLATLFSVRAADEILVVDGGSTDRSAELAQGFGARVIRSPAGRGRQLHTGAQHAGGDWLLFLHADTCLDPAWRTAVAAHVRRSGAAQRVGVFRFRLDDIGWRARAIEAFVALRVTWLALPYGDQGLLLHRDLYRQIGGFRPLPLMEDVDLMERLGRRRLGVLSAWATTSARRWRKDGWISRSVRNLVCLALFKLGMPAERILRIYET